MSVKTERRHFKRILVSDSELPKSVPPGSTCNVQDVADQRRLRRGELVMVLTGGAFRPRRFLRFSEGRVWLGGDEVSDLSVESYEGDLYKVLQVYNDREPVLFGLNSSPATLVNWARTFL